MTKNSDTFCLNELTINNGEKQHANVDHDINTRVKTFFIVIYCYCNHKDIFHQFTFYTFIYRYNFFFV